MRLNRMGIPANILRGESRKYRSVHTVYVATLIQEVMKRVHESFWIRAKGGTDDLGNKWKPLAPSTHAYKPLSPMELNTYKINGKRERGLLTPAQNKKWKLIFAVQLKRLARKMGENEAKKEAAKRAWTELIKEGAETKIGLGRITDINIRTGALVAATYPGKISNNRYYPPKNQKVTVRPRGAVKIQFTLPYIKAVDAVRPVIPDNVSVWIVEAHEIAIVEAKRIYDRINENATRNRTPKKRKTKDNNKSTSRTKGTRSSNSTRSRNTRK